MKWIKAGKTMSEEGSTITYTCDEIPGIKIESRKRHIPHANGEGTWDYTSYFVIKGEKVKEKQSLADAKSLAERMAEDVRKPNQCNMQ